MLYQNILSDDSPYVAQVSLFNNRFPEHRHADIEIHYCLRGKADIVLDKKNYTLNEGDLVFIGPMVSHEVPPQGEQSRGVLTLIVGISFLKEHFNQFSKVRLISPIFRLDDSTKAKRKLKNLISETESYCNKDRKSKLLVQGNIYKIFYYLTELIYSASFEDSSTTARLIAVENIDKALGLIYYDYRKPLTITEAAAVTGYSKSNFCKIFKNITGETFHSLLNRQRVEVACKLLSETNISVSEISELTGLGEAKNFCRIFKAVKGVTPGFYRKSSEKKDKI